MILTDSEKLDTIITLLIEIKALLQEILRDSVTAKVEK
jgi:hypothetical protein